MGGGGDVLSQLDPLGSMIGQVGSKIDPLGSMLSQGLTGQTGGNPLQALLGMLGKSGGAPLSGGSMIPGIKPFG